MKISKCELKRVELLLYMMTCKSELSWKLRKVMAKKRQSRISNVYFVNETFTNPLRMKDMYINIYLPRPMSCSANYVLCWPTRAEHAPLFFNLIKNIHAHTHTQSFPAKFCHIPKLLQQLPPTT